MKHLLQANRWSCTVTSFAMAFDCKVQDITDFLKHDGSEIIWPGLTDPYCRRSFHIQEMIDFGFSRGLAVIQFAAMPSSVPFKELPPYTVEMEPAKRMPGMMLGREGVLTGFSLRGNPHTVAWNGELCLDPNGEMYPADDFNIEVFWMVVEIKSAVEKVS